MSAPILSEYLGAVARIHGTGAGTGEISYYGALANAFNAVGAKLKPRVFCVPNLRNRKRVGFPDMGLFSGGTAAPDTWPEGQPPDRGVVEIDDIPAPLTVKLGSEQVERYLAHHGLVLVTNYRDFTLLGRDAAGRREIRERFDFGCTDADAFFALAAGTRRPTGLATRFTEFLERVLLHQASLVRPEEVAFFLASYARDALARVEEHASLPAFANLRDALQEALGLRFEPPRGEHLFRSTLVQTLFYGLFSAWVEVAREGKKFDWHAAGWNLHVPFVAELFQRIATPQQLRPLGLEQPMEWAAAALERVDRDAFFARFDQAEAVRYFYEPFLAAFDPVLRRELGVWYTPREIVTYMVERVDRVLRTELGLPDGLADPTVWVLDPCCGTGAYLVAVLDRIDRTLKAKGEGALAAADLKTAAMTRVAGFEIMPAPYVIAHWQIGHVLRVAKVPLAEGERAAIYLTNALTGWAAPSGEAAGTIRSPDQTGIRITFPPLADELAAATRVKQQRPILVVLGNPPYNAFAGTSPAEESGLVEPYKRGLQSEWGIKKFNLDDLYVRFFRVAERRIAESTGKGVVCFISNHSWLSYPSFVMMRAHLIRHFNRLWIDNLNGSKFETGKVAPDETPDPSVFSTEFAPEGIQVGTAISLLVKQSSFASNAVKFRDLWGNNKRGLLLSSLLDDNFEMNYQSVTPDIDNKFSLRGGDVSSAYSSWTPIPSIARMPPFNGPVERRGLALISQSRQTLVQRMSAYFDVDVTDSDVASLHPSLMMTGNRIVGPEARKKILASARFDDAKICQFFFKPFDLRWCYLDNIRPLFSEPSPDLLDQSEIISNCYFIVRDTADKHSEGSPLSISPWITDYDFLSGHARLIPVWLWGLEDSSVVSRRPRNRSSNEYRPLANLSLQLRSLLVELGFDDPDTERNVALLPWQHATSIGYAQAWLTENSDGIRSGWPRIPLPDNADLLRASAALGARVAALLDPETPVPGVTAGTLLPALAAIAVPSRRGGGGITETDRAITAGWGHAGKGGAVMPGRGRLIARAYAPTEAATAEHAEALGQQTNDIFLNADAYWSNIPETVWNFTIGGYQVLKKFLSYREQKLLGRALTPAEIRYVRDVARRLAALRLMAPELDANYRACAAAHRPL